MRIVWRAPFSRAYVSFALLSGILLVSVLTPPVREAPVSVCLLHLLFGIAGPGCGMTRAFLFLAHGDLWSALELNPNSLLVFALIVAFWANRGVGILWGWELTLRLSPRWKLGTYVVAAALAASAWVYNLVANPWT